MDGAAEIQPLFNEHNLILVKVVVSEISRAVNENNLCIVLDVAFCGRFGEQYT